MHTFIKRVHVLYFEQITEELVDSYCQKYEDQKKKFAAFFQLKTVLAPCIEAVVVLDRLGFLLEQVFQLFHNKVSSLCGTLLFLLYVQMKIVVFQKIVFLNEHLFNL